MVVRMNGITITSIIVSKGLDGLLQHCVHALAAALHRAEAAGYSIVVVDNASDFPYQKSQFTYNVEMIRCDTHQSFSRCNNAAAARYPNEYYLLLNNDVLLNPTTLKSMVSLISEGHKTGLCGTRLLFPNGTIQHCGVVFGPGDVGPYHLNYARPEHFIPMISTEFQAVTGACMLIRSNLWHELDGLDERYDFGLEDIDLCLRARQRGWKFWCSVTTNSLHFESSTPGRAQLDVNSRRLFMNTWQGKYAIDG